MAALAGNLRRARTPRVLSDGAPIAALRKVRVNYSHPTAGQRARISVSRQAGAALVVIGPARKPSKLITYFNVEIDNAQTVRVVHEINMRAGSADTHIE